MCPSGTQDPSAAAAAAPAIRPAFDVLDADRDGKISSDDLRTFYSSHLPSRPSEDDIRSMISAADADRDGFVQFHEFERVLASAGSAGDGGTVMEEVFRVMDRDGDGRVGFDDLKAYLGMAGMAAGDEDVRAMIRMGGGGEHDGIGLDEFVKILAVEPAAIV